MPPPLFAKGTQAEQAVEPAFQSQPLAQKELRLAPRRVAAVPQVQSPGCVPPLLHALDCEVAQ